MIPYSDYKVGQPYFVSTRCRWFIHVTRPDGVRIAIHYARYKMELHLGRYLDPTEDVHHKDEKKWNDDLDNLEVKQDGVHIREHKQIHFHGGFVICPECDELFEMTEARVRALSKHKKKKPDSKGPFCSPQCALRYARYIRLGV